MKILLDENLPRKLKLSFGDEHEVRTLKEKGWLGRRNGELLGLMMLDGFDAFVTIDKNLQYQQNLRRFSIKLFILNAPNNKIETLQPFLTKLTDLLAVDQPEQIVIVDVG